MASQGPNLAGTGADDSSNGGIAAWKTPGKITAEDGTTASALLRNLQVSHWLKASRFGFTIPAGSTINGIKVEVKKADSLRVSSDSDVRIMKGGVVGGTQEANVDTGWPTALTWITYGSATDLWGLAWTPADINALNFGVVVAGISDTGLPRPPDGHPAVDAIRVTIFYTPPHWGVDSTTHADNVGPTYPPGQKFFDLVTTQAGGNQPEFWGRYIGSTPHTEYNLTLGEVQYLSSRNCKILLIYNGHTNLSVSSTSDGQIAATNAITSARQVAAPEDGTVWLYCDIEPGQSPTRAFFTAWFLTIQSTSGYGAGVYGTTSPAFNTEYCAAYNSAAIPPEYLYNTQPRHTGCDMTYRVFNPTIPACNPPTNPPTVIQQYDIGPTIYGCPVNNAGPNEGVDLDLADDKGFASMWAPTVVPKVVFWKFNPTTGKPQLLYSADGASWTGVDFGTVAAGTTNHLGQQVAVLGSKLLAMGDSPLAVYETTDLVAFTKRYGADLASDFDGRLTLRSGTTPWVAAAASPQIWEDNGAGFTLRFQGLADPYLYHISEGFATMWATFTTILRKWIGGTSWSDVYTSDKTLDFTVWWSRQNRLMLAREKSGSGTGVGEILAFDGTNTPTAVLSSIIDRVGYMTVISDDLYVMAIVTTNGVTGSTWKIYRCTDLNTAILIGQGTLTDTVRPTMALTWHSGTSAFYAAIGSTSLQKIYKAVSPTIGGNPAPTSQLAFTEVYSATDSAANHIRDGVSFGTVA